MSDPGIPQTSVGYIIAAARAQIALARRQRDERTAVAFEAALADFLRYYDGTTPIPKAYPRVELVDLDEVVS